MLSNFIKNPKIWVRSLLDDTAEEVYRAWKKRIDSLTYSFKSELGELKQSSLQDNFTVTDGQMPHVMVLYLQKKISLETFSILAQVTNVYTYWEHNIVDKTVARDIIRLSKKYYPFLNIEKKKFSAIVKDKFDLG
jgi:alpha-amylase/alpha-mannosidase (GH57 family)